MNDIVRKIPENQPIERRVSCSSVPLAVLLAMSPINMNNIEVKAYEPNTIVYVQETQQSPKTRTLYKDAIVPYTSCFLEIVNSPDKKMAVIEYENKANINKKINGEDVPITLEGNYRLVIKSLRAVNLKVNKLNGSVANKKEYYVVGMELRKTKYLLRDGSGKEALPMKSKVIQDSEVKISEDFYNQLADILGENVNYESENREKKESSEYDKLY
ncbi:MAG: hypothetical protein IJK46_08515 [Prevotella sp.]|nr:hypothetical protein [Prevotella sp.]